MSLAQYAMGWIDVKPSRLAVLGRRRETGFWDWDPGARWGGEEKDGEAEKGTAGVTQVCRTRTQTPKGWVCRGHRGPLHQTLRINNHVNGIPPLHWLIPWAASFGSGKC